MELCRQQCGPDTVPGYQRRLSFRSLLRLGWVVAVVLLCLLGVQCKRRSVCLSCPSRWQRHFGLDWIGCLRCVRTSDPTPTNRDRHSHPSASPAGQPDLLALTDTVSAASTSYHFGTNERYTRQRGFGGARLIDASVAAPSVANISRSRNKERRDVWPPRHFRQPRSSPCCLLPGHAKNGSGNRSYQESRRRRLGSGSGSGVARWMQLEWMRCDAMRCDACTAGCAGYGCVITDQSVCGHVKREEFSERGGAVKLKAWMRRQARSATQVFV
jgi:hypothetical protein